MQTASIGTFPEVVSSSELTCSLKPTVCQTPTFLLSMLRYAIHKAPHGQPQLAVLTRGSVIPIPRPA
ncbi:hypothetical protein TNCT_634411, partial [Trichonephila clavata]